MWRAKYLTSSGRADGCMSGFIQPEKAWYCIVPLFQRSEPTGVQMTLRMRDENS
jgi:hypothetical protein